MNREIILATNNKHKLQEVREILSPKGFIVYGLNDLQLKPEEVEENGKTYRENALLKAKSVQKLTEMPIIADDSGLEILAMNNEPGLHTARFAEMNGGFDNAFKVIFQNIEGKDRTAKFHCSIVLLNVEDKPLYFDAEVLGRIAENPYGKGGFGFDPIFVCEEENMTYAEIPQEKKNKVSHRAKALLKLVTYFRINHLIK
ncbi:MAG: RdgB/HAM1 family non-canonical purine NTP pyrophosphatase [Bacilli bacterium]|nr:RdgB/HAM1 family non-canonical purine NTP pyrophosphatase [Bacilli bacterium]